MRKYILILCVHLAVLPILQAQEEFLPKKQDWFFYDVGHARLLETPAGVENSPWGNSHSLSFMFEKLLGKSPVSLALGFGYSSVNYRNNLRVSADEQTGAAKFSSIPDSIGYDKNKTNAKYFEIPLEIRFRTKPNKEGRFFRWYLGARPGVRLGGYSQFSNDELDVRYHGLPELNRWRMAVYSRIGFGRISLFALYDLLPVYDYNQSPTLFVNDVDANGMQGLAVGFSLSL